MKKQNLQTKQAISSNGMLVAGVGAAVCQRAIKNTSFQTFTEHHKCGKVAVTMCSGLPVCQHHYNKWRNKMQRKIKQGIKITEKI